MCCIACLARGHQCWSPTSHMVLWAPPEMIPDCRERCNLWVLQGVTQKNKTEVKCAVLFIISVMCCFLYKEKLQKVRFNFGVASLNENICRFIKTLCYWYILGYTKLMDLYMWKWIHMSYILVIGWHLNKEREVQLVFINLQNWGLEQ